MKRKKCRVGLVIRSAACALVLGGCLPQASGSEDIAVIDLVDGEYRTVVRTVPLDSLDPLISRHTQFVRGGRFIRETGGGGEVVTEPQPYAPWVERGVDGTLVPVGTDALWSFCFISHLENTIDRIDSLELDVSPTRRFAVLLHPDFVIDGESYSDNMAYIYGSRIFLIAPLDRLDRLPLACNHGVVAHEYGHAISDSIAPYTNTFDAIAVQEGFADIIAAGVTGTANVIDASASVPSRDLSVLRVAHANTAPGQVYVRGMVFASVFWSYKIALEEGGRDTRTATDEMLRTAIEGMRALDPATSPTPELFVLASVRNASGYAHFCRAAVRAYPESEAISEACP